MKHRLSDYDFPAELKTMTERELGLLSFEIRDFLIDKVSKTGGHIASNLGTVELTIALHSIFNSPVDKILWDVGHQSYVHKILTGRAEAFDSLRCFDGLSGFPKRKESPHDAYDAGHASTSISVGMGYAAARDLNGEDYSVVSVIGDGAMTGGVAFEALNNAGSWKSNLIVILNDNEMSINKNHGGLSQHLGKLRASQTYLGFKRQMKKTLEGIPIVGEGLRSGFGHIRDAVKYAIVPGAIFEEFGFTYFGPIDGHSIHDLREVLTLAKEMDGPVLVHVVTKKGKGYRNAESDPSKYHGIGCFDPETGKTQGSNEGISYSDLAGKTLTTLAATDDKIVAISAAMIDGTGLSHFQRMYPERTYDVGIAEQHAVSFAAGLALNGYRPVVAIYSTFLQRAYDQIIEDICQQNLPVTFLIDRAGNVGNDGETHHGIFDLSYLSHIPELTVMAPKDGDELVAMMEYALSTNRPCAIRYPRGTVEDLSLDRAVVPIDGRCEVLQEGSDVSLIAIGKMVAIALDTAERLRQMGFRADVINARFLRPMDRETIIASGRKTGRIVTMEDNVILGGFGAEILTILASEGLWEYRTLCIGWPDKFIPHGDTDVLFRAFGMDAKSISERVRGFIEGTS
ncbi:MAG: 1-deoxy-D-xylulose-5-phosphate synthase [Firmicutes bacterium HGW-Firmicutes-11]|jgi:1-deoxy-D-xylulose-5-phosphate synthase|nr:MAG: 1-deoxy-D-xylulose-5-phosphate synthase [Firmicutes bacterium HGW-Firmicutes-11]